jgi:hypothetical protein
MARQRFSFVLSSRVTKRDIPSSRSAGRRLAFYLPQCWPLESLKRVAEFPPGLLPRGGSHVGAISSASEPGCSPGAEAAGNTTAGPSGGGPVKAAALGSGLSNGSSSPGACSTWRIPSGCSSLGREEAARGRSPPARPLRAVPQGPGPAPGGSEVRAEERVGLPARDEHARPLPRTGRGSRSR